MSLKSLTSAPKLQVGRNSMSNPYQQSSVTPLLDLGHKLHNICTNPINCRPQFSTDKGKMCCSWKIWSSPMPDTLQDLKCLSNRYIAALTLFILDSMKQASMEKACKWFYQNKAMPSKCQTYEGNPWISIFMWRKSQPYSACMPADDTLIL